MTCDAAYGSNPDRCYLDAGHTDRNRRVVHTNRWGTTWADDDPNNRAPEEAPMRNNTCTNIAHPEGTNGAVVRTFPNGTLHVALECPTCGRVQGVKRVPANAYGVVGETRPVPTDLPVGACGQCDRCLMQAHVPTGAGWSNCGHSGK